MRFASVAVIGLSLACRVSILTADDQALAAVLAEARAALGQYQGDCAIVGNLQN
jgi:hypothetical protein